MLRLLLTMFAANAALIGVDWLEDPTDHNLFPLEFALILVLCLPGFVAEWIAARLAVRR